MNKVVEPVATATLKEEWPCHTKPQSEWCDRYGPGGFMGHTCKTTARIWAKSRMEDAERAFSAAENRLHEANRNLGKAREAFKATSSSSPKGGS